MATTIAPDTPKEPRELGPKAGSSAIKDALSDLKERADKGTFKLTDDSDPALIAQRNANASQLSSAHAAAAAAALGETTEIPEGESQPPDDSIDPSWKQDADGRWRDATGKFVKPTTDQPTGDAVAAEGAKEATKATEGEAPEPIIVKFAAQDMRPEIEIEVADQEVADRIRELQNNGIRKAEFTKRLEAIEERETTHRATEAVLKRAPEAFVMERLEPKQAVALAQSLLAVHWDALLAEGTLHAFADQANGAGARAEARATFKERTIEAREQMKAEREQQRATQKIYRAIDVMIPQDWADEKKSRVYRVLEADLIAAINRNEVVAPETVEKYVSPVLRDFGWDPAAPAVAGKNGSSSTQRDPAAAPRQAAATRSASSTAPRTGSRDSAQQDAEARMRTTAAVRRTAKAVAPAGAGGVPAATPTIPKGAGVKGAIQFLRDNPGMLRTIAPEGT